MGGGSHQEMGGGLVSDVRRSEVTGPVLELLWGVVSEAGILGTKTK